jgi:3-hydroxy-9,10-secoandrosta-1,3,5(10)-triene-9,17-dione monooxygenase reductase component
MSSGTLDTRRYRDVLGRFASGVVVVAGLVDGRPRGLSCQSFFSVSLDPPLIAISPARSSSSWREIEGTGAFAISVLSRDQRGLCLTFGRGGPRDKFATTPWRQAPSGAPLINGAVAWLDCAVEAVHSAGDHLLVLGRVMELWAGDGDPLLFHRGAFGGFAGDEPWAVSGGPDWDAHELWGPGLWLEGIDW